MRHLAAFLVLGLLAACAAPKPAAQDTTVTPIATSLDTLAAGAVCRIGPDGGPVVVTDRGIGGTGAPQAASQVTDRGIGGTGIVGVITGFASVCVDGLEVAYDSTATVDIDGTNATTSDLRVGQIVAIQAVGPALTPVAHAISVRRQVTGRIEAIELGSGTLTVAGQPVSVPAGTWGADTVRLGDWVAVSGLRRADGMLIASRLDLAAPETVAVRGQVVREGATVRIGQLVLTGTEAANLQSGDSVLVSGQYTAGHAQIRSVVRDPLFSNPAAYFGSSVNHLVVQAYVRVANGLVYLNGLKATAGPGVNGHTGADGVAIVSLERKSDGTFTAVGLRYTDRAGSPPGANHAPGPISRGDSIPLPQARRSGSKIASLTGGATVGSGGSLSGGPLSGGQPAAAVPVNATQTSGMTSSSGSSGTPATTGTSATTGATAGSGGATQNIMSGNNNASSGGGGSGGTGGSANGGGGSGGTGGPANGGGATTQGFSPTQGLTSSIPSQSRVTALVKPPSLQQSFTGAQTIQGGTPSAATVSLATAAAETPSAKTPAAVLAPPKSTGIKTVGSHLHSR